MTEETNASSKYDYVTCKDLLHSGSPAVYQLIPKRQIIGTLERLTLGKRDPKKTHKTILLVGETGTGKSTLINALVNYAIDVKWEDNVWFEIVNEDEKKDQSQSQTSDVIVYEIFGFEDKKLPYSLTIIDTPGYGDTRGTEQDDMVSQRLLDLFRSEDGVYEINAVGLVLKSSDNRLSDRLRYIFDSVVSLFSKNMENNIVTLITHSDGRTPKEALKALEAANIKCAKNEKYQPVHFLFNNCQNTERKQGTFALEASWKITMTGLSEFTDFLQNLLPKNLITTADVLNSRIRLTARIQNLQERVKLLEHQQTEIRKTQEALNKHKEDMKSNENFIVEVDEAYKVKKDIGGWRRQLVFYDGAVTCKVCEENCHYPGCTMAWYPRDCEVMRKGRCTVCTNKCPVSDHEKKQEIYETETRKVKRTLEDVEKKYESSKADCEKATSLLGDLQRKMEELQKDKDTWLNESFEHVMTLEKNALNVDALSTHAHLDFLIKSLEEKGETEKVEKLKKIKSRGDEGTKVGLRYKETPNRKADKETTK